LRRVTTTVTLNNQQVRAEAPPHYTLLRWLRDLVGAHEVKEGCGEGVCGACTVLVDGRPVSSCCVLAVEVDGAEVCTSRGLLHRDGTLSRLQQCFWEAGAAQCGFCTQGMLITASALLASGAKPSREEIREALRGNLCRCTGYQAIVNAVERAASAPEVPA